VRIYVGNLWDDVASEQVRAEFAAFGRVVSVTLAADKSNGRPTGSGFVEMSSPLEAEAAVAGLNGRNIKGRALAVSTTKLRPSVRSGGYRAVETGG
jgi:RNA recognition motif-containing protein